jgi:predicted nucleic acid-binding protein
MCRRGTILERYCAEAVVSNDEPSALAAMDLKAKAQMYFWDSFILEAARRSGSITLDSEELSNVQQVGGITLVNPFEV